jgi:hypothetical protein
MTAPTEYGMTKWVAAGTAALLLAGCIGDSITDSTGDALPENRGTEVNTGVDVSPLAPIAWSADGTEIYFQTNESPPRLMATTLTGETRALDGPRDGFFDLVVSTDGAHLYYIADLRGGRRSLYRLALPNGPAEVIADDVSPTLPHTPADGSIAMPAPAGGLAYTSLPDSTFLIDATGERIVLGNGCERIVAFAPAGDRLLCQIGGGGAGAYFDIVIATRTITPVVVSPAFDALLIFVNWDANGVRAFYETPTGLALWDVARQAVTLNASFPPRATIVLDRRNGEWSDDGNRVAFWLHECLRSQGLNRCIEGQSMLNILEPRNQRSSIIAVAHGTEGGGSMALSRNGDRVAYVFDLKLYVQSTAFQ